MFTTTCNNLSGNNLLTTFPIMRPSEAGDTKGDTLFGAPHVGHNTSNIVDGQLKLLQQSERRCNGSHVCPSNDASEHSQAGDRFLICLTFQWGKATLGMKKGK